MFDTLPFIGSLWKARKRYEQTCKYIDGMTELREDERECAKEFARQKLMIETTKYAARQK